MPTARTLACGVGDFDHRYRIETPDGQVALSADRPADMPDGATFWRRQGGLWIEIPRPTAAEYEDAF